MGAFGTLIVVIFSDPMVDCLSDLSTLIGAACMNNTFCLCIFLFIIYFQGLAWQYTAETIAIMLVQWFIAAIAISSEIQTRFMSFVILSCYPGCLVIVKVLETMGFD